LANISAGDYVDGTDGDYLVDPLFEEITPPENHANGLMYNAGNFALEE